MLLLLLLLLLLLFLPGFHRRMQSDFTFRFDRVLIGFRRLRAAKPFLLFFFVAIRFGFCFFLSQTDVKPRNNETKDKRNRPQATTTTTTTTATPPRGRCRQGKGNWRKKQGNKQFQKTKNSKKRKEISINHIDRSRNQKRIVDKNRIFVSLRRIESEEAENFVPK